MAKYHNNPINGKKLRRVETLIGELFDDTCSLAGVTAGGRTPVLTACRQALALGINPASAVEIYRQGVLALRIRTLAAGAQLTVEECSDGRPRFRSYRPPPSEGSPSIRFDDPPKGAPPLSRKTAPAGVRTAAYPGRRAQS